EGLDSIDSYRVANGSSPARGVCPDCARYRTTVFEVGDRLTSPVEGLGLRRQSRELRQLAGIAQMALDPGDPVNYARHMLLDPPSAEDVPDAGRRGLLMINTAGDTIVSASAGASYARAAGL